MQPRSRESRSDCLVVWLQPDPVIGSVKWVSGATWSPRCDVTTCWMVCRRGWVVGRWKNMSHPTVMNLYCSSVHWSHMINPPCWRCGLGWRPKWVLDYSKEGDRSVRILMRISPYHLNFSLMARHLNSSNIWTQVSWWTR